MDSNTKHKRKPEENESSLESAAQLIGSTLGHLAVATGIGHVTETQTNTKKKLRGKTHKAGVKRSAKPRKTLSNVKVKAGKKGGISH